jgi:hypothetical protein
LFREFPLFDNGGYEVGRRSPSFVDVKTNPVGSLSASGKCAKRQPHFRAKRKPIFFFRYEFLGVLKLLADWNPACNENQLFEL